MRKLKVTCAKSKNGDQERFFKKMTFEWRS